MTRESLLGDETASPLRARVVWLACIGGAMLLAACIQWPALGGCLFDDDYLQVGFLSGLPTMPARYALDLYSFEDVAFFRPLSSLLMAADWRLFHTTLWAYHAHSLLWYLALVASAAAVFRRAIPTAAGIAAVVFALGRFAGDTVVWWCSRHLLVSAVFACVALTAHLRWRQDQWRPGRWLALAALLIALLGGESAVQAAAYLIAFELVGTRARWRSRMAAIGAIAAVALAHIVLRWWLGYGVRTAKWGYVDPFSEPRHFVVEAWHRLAELAPKLLGGGIDALVFVPGATGLAWVMVLLLSGMAVLVLCGVRLGLPDDEARALRALLLGGVLALPIALACPAPRVRALPGIAVAALIAVLLRQGAAVVRGRIAVGASRRVAAGLAVIALALACGVAAPKAARADVAEQSRFQRTMHQAMVNLDFDREPRRVVILSGPPELDPLTLVRRVFRGTAPASSWILYSGDHALVAVRNGTRELVLGLPDGEVISDGPWSGLKAGDSVMGSGLVATVVEATDAGPTMVSLMFDDPLDTPSLALLTWRDDALVRINPPALDDAMVLDSRAHSEP